MERHHMTGDPPPYPAERFDEVFDAYFAEIHRYAAKARLGRLPAEPCPNHVAQGAGRDQSDAHFGGTAWMRCGWSARRTPSPRRRRPRRSRGRRRCSTIRLAVASLARMRIARVGSLL